MSIKVDFDVDYLVKYIKEVKIACDNFAKAMAEYVASNEYKILKELVEENDRLLRAGEDSK